MHSVLDVASDSRHVRTLRTANLPTRIVERSSATESQEVPRNSSRK